MQIQLDGKTALVCGSSAGIGLECARAIADIGAKVTLCARNEAALDAALETLPGAGHCRIVADFDQPDQLASAVQSHIDDNGSFAILVNNSGGPPGGPILDADSDEFLTAIKRHVVGNHRLAQIVVPGMKEIGYGRIVNIISTSVREPISNLGVSNTTRGAVAAWAKTLSKELGPDGITVNSVLPGFTDTARLAQLMEKRAAAEGTTADQIASDWIDSIPLGRFASAEEIGTVVAFLCSPAASYISGVCLPVDGGRLNVI
jgi:3-oxoacyl-[acyl-carrier protein] reductase